MKKTHPLTALIKTTINTFALSLLLAGCVETHDGPLEYESLELLQTHDLDITGPSALSNSYLPGHFYTFCDTEGEIYLINNTGQILLTLPIDGDDLEGVEFVEETQKLYVLEEKFRFALKVSPDGTILDTFELDIPIQNLNDGPEGIAYNPHQKHFYVVNQRNPSILYVYDTLFVELAAHPLGFADDYSSLHFAQEDNYLWILSQKSKLLARCNLEGEPNKIFQTNVPDGEGLVVDLENQRIYITCDDTSTLYVFKLPDI